MTELLPSFRNSMTNVFTFDQTPMHAPDKLALYSRFLLLVAGFGGLLYGVDVGIMGGALPYLEATSGLNAGQLSVRRLYGDLLHHSCLIPAGNQRQDIGRNRRMF